jgi:hypothetical protein
MIVLQPAPHGQTKVAVSAVGLIVGEVEVGEARRRLATGEGEREGEWEGELDRELSGEPSGEPSGEGERVRERETRGMGGGGRRCVFEDGIFTIC